MSKINRIAYSTQRIEEFKSDLSDCTELVDKNNLCIFSTGSYGRLEASKHSDLDLFFLHNENLENFPKIPKTLIDAHIINTCRTMKLPEFSGDGEYLEIHNLNDLYKEIGSRNDDYHNYFTARMLLLLESQPVFNQSLYYEILETTVNKYYKDFNRHEKNFQPVFLVNDVIRFWRTMCLNYEHNRHRKLEGKHTKEELEVKKNESHLKNLKLKFSRKLTCYSFLLSILWAEKLKEDNVLEIIKMTPVQRLERLGENATARKKVKTILQNYEWFLDTTQVDKKNIIKWISKQEHRDIAFDKSRNFTKLIFDLMVEAPNKEKLMYFLI